MYTATVSSSGTEVI